MLRAFQSFAFLVAFAASPLTAQPADPAKFDALFDAVGLTEVIAIMREEGLDYGAVLGADMLPDGGSVSWNATVSEIYDTQGMTKGVRAHFADALVESDIDAMLAFYTSDLGAKIIELELSARRAMLDEDVAEAGVELAQLARMDETPRFLMAQTLVDENNLIEGNVEGSLNSSYAFYMGLIEGGGMPTGITDETAIQDVWAQEAAMRATATDWVYSFVMMAYQPLSDDEMAQLIAFSRSAAGQDMTNAMFGAFNPMFTKISREMGFAVSQFMLTQQL